MGIQDRDYYRKNYSNRFGGLAGGYSAVGVLVFVYAALYLLQVLSGPRNHYALTLSLVFDSKAIEDGQVWRLFTGFWLHPPFIGGAIFCVCCNLLTLWWAGKGVADIYGDKEFFSSYLVMGLLASIATFIYCIITGDSTKIFLATAPVAGVLTLFALHYPRNTVLLFFVLPVNIWLCVGLIVLKDFFILAQKDFDIGLALADFTAIALALGYHTYHWRTYSFIQRLNVFKSINRRTQLQVYRDRESIPTRTEEPVLVAHPEANPLRRIPDEQLEARLDEVLEKVQKQGQAHLTEEERELLFRASEIYRKRRKGDK